MGDHRDRRDEQPRKIFLGGLSAATEEPSLRDYFGKFGEIDDCCVIRTSGPDQQKKSRGFGFVTFNSIACVDAVMAQRINGKLIIDGKDVEIKQAMSREDANENPSVTEKVYKVFIGGIGQLSQQQIQDYFSGYGEVKEVIVKNEDQKKRPYGFVIFEDHEVVDKIVVRKHNIDGQDVDCKKAAQRQGGQRGGQGGGGWKDNGGRGGGYQGGRGYGGDGGSYGGGNDYYGGGGAYGGGSYGGSGGYGGGYGGASGGGYGGGYGGGATGGYGGSAGGYGGAGGYGAAGGYESGAGGYGGATGGDSSFGSGYGSQSSSYGPVRQSTGSGRYGGGQSSAPYGNYGSGSYGSGGSGGGAGGRRY